MNLKQAGKEIVLFKVNKKDISEFTNKYKMEYYKQHDVPEINDIEEGYLGLFPELDKFTILCVNDYRLPKYRLLPYSILKT